MSEYGDRLRAKGIGFLSRGLTKPKVVETKDSVGRTVKKATTDELGNTVTEHNNKKDQVDVHIRAPQIRLVGTQKEVRDA